MIFMIELKTQRQPPPADRKRVLSAEGNNLSHCEEGVLFIRAGRRAGLKGR
jgi:hypothetical protein